MPDTVSTRRLSPTLEARAGQGRDEVVALRKAARRLPGREADIRRWLREQGLVRDLAGREVVVWGEVLDAMPKTTEPKIRQPRKAAAPQLDRLHRVNLRS